MGTSIDIPLATQPEERLAEVGVIDLSHWLQPIDGAHPSGVSLRDEPLFHDIERLIEPQFQIIRDDRNNAASQVALPVSWSEVLAKADELRTRGRDLRLLVLVARALVGEHGLAGLADGLTLIARSLEEHWDTMHPELKQGPSVADRALRRVNALLQLQNESDGLLGDLRKLVALSPRGIGPLTGQDLERAALDERTMLNEAAQGLGQAERATLIAAHEQNLNRVRAGCAAMLDQDSAALAEAVAALEAGLAACVSLDAALAARLGAGRAAAPDLKRFLERVSATLQHTQSASKPGNGQATETPSLAAKGANGHADLALPSSLHLSGGALPDRIGSRDDVVRCLDLVIAFYDRTEPSSPIPHLARRIRRMVPMDFLELMEDLAPSGLKEFRMLAGVTDAKKQAAPSSKDER